MEILWKMRARACVCVCVSDVSVDARLTVIPSDTTALAGTQVVLRCTTSRSGPPPRIHWIRIPDYAVVVYNCAVRPGYESQYSVISNETGRCDLVITAATLGLAASYRCADILGDVAVTELTVIGEWCFLFVVCCSTVGFVLFPTAVVMQIVLVLEQRLSMASQQPQLLNIMKLLIEHRDKN